MGFELGIFAEGQDTEQAGSTSSPQEGEQLEADFLDWLIENRWPQLQRRYELLWDYYTNARHEFLSCSDRDKAEGCGRSYVQAQEYGLPARITGFVRNMNAGVFGGSAIKDVQRKEVVIENDIGWRINAAVDFLFGKPIDFVSRSPIAQKRSEIEGIIKAVFGANGGIGFFQDMAVLGSVYGFVDCFVRPGEEIYKTTSNSSENLSFEGVLHRAQAIGLELIEAPRALPVLDEDDYRVIRYYVQHFCQRLNSVSGRKPFWLRIFSAGGGAEGRKTVSVTEIVSAKAWQRYEDGQLVAEGENWLGFLPVVHIQNLAQPFYYEGISDIEPLIPLQDELNTRLSDRANRITFQSFKMYLGKGVEGFEDKPVSPGRMWCTDNPEATIEEFGGDGGTPSEDRHISEIREAMDKVSSVTPIVAGVLRGRVGNLTSAVALRLMLMGMLSKTERKRFTYGEGLKRICSIILEILDKAGVYRTTEQERTLDVIFPSPLPENVLEKLQEAQIKKDLGVPVEQVLRELGYGKA